MSKYSIELDCPPGDPRPGDLLPEVLEGTGVALGEPDGTFFGNWTWNIPVEQEEAYEKAREVIKERIKALYARGLIRYGSW